MSDGEEMVPWEVTAPQTQEERLTEQFYQWEKRGRGWQVFSYPVQLEPAFRPFIFHYVPPGPVFDDARKPTFLSSMVERIRNRLVGPSITYDKSIPLLEDDLTEPEPEIFTGAEDLVEIQIALPSALKISKEVCEQFLLSLTYCSRPLSFEILGLPDSVIIQLVCREGGRSELRQQLEAHFPEAVLKEIPHFLRQHWNRNRETVVADFGLSQEFMLPLRVSRGFDVDPHIGIIGALTDIQEGELGLLQVLFQPTRHPWVTSIIRSMTDWEGRPFFADAPEMSSLAKQKITYPLFAAVIRVAGQSSVYGRAWQIAKALGGSLNQFANPAGNELMPLSSDDYSEELHWEDVLSRQTRRSGMLLNMEELVSLVHLPSASVRSEKFKREERRTRAAPSIATGHRLILGENTHAGKTSRVSLSPDQRTRHTYVLGASGTGKSTLLLNLIIQDIQNGEGIGVLDPHGDLIDQVLGHIPEERFDDVVLLDPSDEDWPVGFNILSAHSELEKNLLSSDLVAVFRRLSTSWGDQMTSVLGNAIIAFLESAQGGGLADLRRFLVEADFRRGFLETVRDPEVVYYWQKEFPLLTGKPQGPILTRLDSFLRPKLIRNMVTQKENRLDFGAIMNERKIFLAKLAQGVIGEENAYLLGALLVSKFHQLAMGRQQVAVSKRRDFYLYIDEFHHFITPSMASLLSGARKYHLGLVLAHQELQQLWNRDSDVASAVISNPCTRICFRLGDFDAKKLEDGFGYFKAEDLQNLGIGDAICRIDRSEYDFNLKTLPLPAIETEMAGKRKEHIAALSRQKYALPRGQVEQELRKERPAAHPPVATIETPPPEKPREGRRKARLLRPPEEPPKPAEKPKPSLPMEPVPLGRGGQEHKYLQQLIKRLAEDRGYRAIVEKPILGGSGNVDVSLEKDERKIACEISVSSTSQQELLNIQKCLAGGYDQIILLSSDRKNLREIKESVSAQLVDENIKKVFFFVEEELIAHLDEIEAQALSKEQLVRGYKIKVKYKSVSEEEKKVRKQAIAKVILGALKRLKGQGK